jgi:hypothetical protein
MGKVEKIEFTGYELLAARFREEVQELWRKENENGQRTEGRHWYGESVL